MTLILAVDCAAAWRRRGRPLPHGYMYPIIAMRRAAMLGWLIRWAFAAVSDAGHLIALKMPPPRPRARRHTLLLFTPTP